MNVTWIGSPNYADGRAGHTIKKIILHYINGYLSASDATFQDTVRNTSAHYAIQDDPVHQYVKEGDTAYHAGNLLVNYESIGIEHSADPERPPSDETYKTSIELITTLCQRYGLSENDIYPHNSIVPTQCPGTVDVNRIKAGVKAKLEGEVMLDGHDIDYWHQAAIDATKVATRRREYTNNILETIGLSLQNIPEDQEHDMILETIKTLMETGTTYSPVKTLDKGLYKVE